MNTDVEPQDEQHEDQQTVETIQYDEIDREHYTDGAGDA